MSQDQTSADPAQIDDSMPIGESLPVELRFEVGVITLPFGQVQTLAPGCVFELAKPLDQRLVTIAANGMPVAEGSLVSIGEMTGVRIERMLLPKRTIAATGWPDIACEESDGAPLSRNDPD